MRFSLFLIFYFMIVAIAAILSLLLSIGMHSMVFQILRVIVIVVPITLILSVLKILISRSSKRVVKAPPIELSREDDVLLQATAFSQSLVFVLVNFTLTDGHVKLFLSLWIGVSLAVFYAFRAYAKIRGSPKYRYYSVYLLGLVITNTVGVAMFVLANQTVPQFSLTSIVPDWFLLVFGPFYAWDVFRDFTREILKKRYGY